MSSSAGSDSGGRPARGSGRRGLIVALCVIGVLIASLAVLYMTGSLDRQLASAGLNYEECATGPHGTTLCGEELQQARATQRRLAREAREIEAEREAEHARYRKEREHELQELEHLKYRRAGESQATTERSQRAARRKIEEEREAEG